MKIFIICLLSILAAAIVFAGLAYSQEKPASPPAAAKAAGPQAIPASEHEALSRKMLAAQTAYNRLMQAQVQMKDAQQAAESAAKDWTEALSAAQKKYHAEGCSLNLDKSWSCEQK